MIWKIAKKEILLNLMTFKFAVGTMLCMVLIALFVLVLVNDYQRRLEKYDKHVADNEAELRKVKVYKNITPTLYRRPVTLSVFSEGVQKRLSNAAKIEWESIPEISATSDKINPYLSIFPAFDIALILEIVVSALALLVAYDAISGEREQGTLRLLLSGAVSRYYVLFGKILAGLLTLLIPIAISFIMAFLILELSGVIDLTGSDWARIGLMGLASMIFVAVMYQIGLLFSCVARRPAISLTLALLIWVVLVVVIPNASVCVATIIQPIEPGEKTHSRIMSLQEEFDRERDRLIWRLYEENKSKPNRSVSGARGAFGRGYAKAITRAYLDEQIQRLALPLRMRYADKMWEVERSYGESLLKQKRLSDSLSRISPVSLHATIMASLAGTDLASVRRFTNEARTYRSAVIEYIRLRTNNLSSASILTPFTDEDMRECELRVIQRKQAL